MAAAPPFLRGGFRPFFFGGAVWAVVALALWAAALTGALTISGAFEPLAWHRHEMLFGFVGAVVAGFLLTTVPNWTGRLPIAGAPLAALFGVWLVARLAVLFSAIIGIVPAALLDIGFYLLLAGLAAREVRARKNRNVPTVGLVLLFGIANAVDYAAAFGWFADDGLGWRLGLGLVVLMISLIGGRIIPSFTHNWLAKRGVSQGLPGQPGRFDLATIAITALGLLTWVATPERRYVGAVLLAAGLLQTIRLARWRGLRAAADPLVLILHIGYAWVPVGLVLLAASILGAPIPRSAAIHALTAGAMATMILAVMTRASLSHTGRELKASPLTVLLYALVTGGALLRVSASLGLLDYGFGMEVAAVTWAGAFLVFLVDYGPILFGPRLGGGSLGTRRRDQTIYIDLMRLDIDGLGGGNPTPASAYCCVCNTRERQQSELQCRNLPVCKRLTTGH
ncbi:NnrS family protein [Sphingomonas psychrotolerans]|uniref:NnrS family protein n=2 Tax=Sphingomonas psychrotolerans TaxID=1327635 RepID=A0A2K8MLK1_9SPHN|nr:NnrS family protein [Sphingomonas psychrotolerans]